MSRNTHQMEYNSQKDKLIIPEYGRNIQMLIQYAVNIEEDDYRQAFIEKIIELMHQMHPQNRNVEDYILKLWKHVFIIADFELDVLPPNGIKPSREEAFKKPERVAYPHSETPYKHYGNNVQLMINKALEMEEGPVRSGFVGVIGSYMKLAYRTWNKEHYVSDDIIRRDLIALSKGKLALDDNASLDTLSSKRKSSNNYSQNHSSRRGSSNGRNNSNNYRRKNNNPRNKRK